jgi:hypothetical protein
MAPLHKQANKPDKSYGKKEIKGNLKAPIQTDFHSMIVTGLHVTDVLEIGIWG